MFLVRLALCSLVSLVFLAAWPASAHAQRKHPAELKGIKSTNGDVETSIIFVNNSKQPIKVFWLNYEGKREGATLVMPGDNHAATTALTHPFLITDKFGNAWYVYFPDSQERTVEIVAPKKK